MTLLADLEAVNARWADAIAHGNARAAAAVFTDDGTVIAADSPNVQGRDQLEALFQSWIDFGMCAERYGDGAAEPIGDGAMLTCAYEADLRQADGSLQVERGRNLQVFRRGADGIWKIRALGITTNSAGPA